MDYLNDYLRVIPKADSDAIRKALKEQEKNFGLEEVDEAEFERLLHQISEENTPLAMVPELGERLEAEPLNAFFSALAVDLSRLFSEQAAIETASENYDHIYRASLEEIQRAVDSLEESVSRLEKQSRGERGLIIRSYGFEPANAPNMTEDWNADTAYLFADRDGTPLLPAETVRHYHEYSLSLAKKKKTDALRDEGGNTTARLEILYETPGTLENQNPAYQPQKAVDGTSDTFWFNVCLKANNGLDQVTIAPQKRS